VDRSHREQGREQRARVNRSLLHQGSIFSLFQDRLFYEDGKTQCFDIVVHPGAVVLVPIDSRGRLILIKQWRRGAQQVLIECPAGIVEKGECLVDSAQRELREETGMRAGRLVSLGDFFSAPGYCTECFHFFLAEDLVEDPLWSEDSELIDLFPLSLEEGFTLIERGKIVDIKTSMGIFLYRFWKARRRREGG